MREVIVFAVAVIVGWKIGKAVRVMQDTLRALDTLARGA